MLTLERARVVNREFEPPPGGSATSRAGEQSETAELNAEDESVFRFSVIGFVQ